MTDTNRKVVPEENGSVRFLTCICCPMGCPLEVRLEEGEVLSVSGNTCPRGAVYARKEVTDPTRIVTSLVPVTNSMSGARVVPCKTKTDIPKAAIFDVIQDLKKVTAIAPVHIGDVLLENAGNTGTCVIATKEIT